MIHLADTRLRQSRLDALGEWPAGTE